MKNRKSITFVSPFGLPLLRDMPGVGAGGAERQFFLFGQGLEKRGWSVCFITDNNVPDGNAPTTMPVKMASFSFLRGNKRRLLFDCISIFWAMWRADSNYYVLKTPAYLLVPMHFFTGIFRRKLVFWAQMEFDAYPNLRPFKKTVNILLDMGIHRADIILAQNSSQVEGFKVNFGKEARLIKNISGDLSGKDIRFSRDGKKVDVLWVGNSLSKKRHEVVIALAKILPEYEFAMAMNRADPARYAEAEAECRSVSNIRFLGEVNPTEMESWYGRTRLLLNTSTQEGFPNTFLQAWRNGVPVLSLCVDPDDVVKKHDLGIVIDKSLTELCHGDAEWYAGALVAAANKLLSSDAMYDRFSTNAKTYVAENHGEDALVRKLEEALRF
jgi:glycosyltransferase involved in cell wall biosynthesis